MSLDPKLVGCTKKWNAEQTWEGIERPMRHYKPCSEQAERKPTGENVVTVSPIWAILMMLVCISVPAAHHEEQQHEAHKITATTPQMRPVTLTQPYVCQIHSQRHIKVRALEMGYLKEIKVREGQQVKEDDTLFEVIPILYQKKADAEKAEANLANLQVQYARQLARDKVVSINEVNLREAEFAKADAKAELAKAELGFATVKAPFDGIIDRLHLQHGSLVEEGEVLTTLSDNSVMWVYFNVPEARIWNTCKTRIRTS